MTITVRGRNGLRSRMARRLRGVTLNGRMVPSAFYADGRRGVVRHYLYDLKGRIVAHPLTDEPIPVERRGVVGWVKKAA
jgi:hypothetical protein